MNTRQQLVDDWKANLAANSQGEVGQDRRFVWFRQIYSRIYRFLISYYGEASWRADCDDSTTNVDAPSNASRMPFVDYRPIISGLAPKSTATIRASLESIRHSNPGIASPGATIGVEENHWILVAARRKRREANKLLSRLHACGIDACLHRRTTDVAIAVPYKEFSHALLVVEDPTTPRIGNRQRGIWIRKTLDSTTAAGLVLLLTTGITVLACVFVNDGLPLRSFAVCGLWLAGLAAGWLALSGRKSR